MCLLMLYTQCPQYKICTPRVHIFFLFSFPPLFLFSLVPFPPCFPLFPFSLSHTLPLSPLFPLLSSVRRLPFSLAPLSVCSLPPLLSSVRSPIRPLAVRPFPFPTFSPTHSPFPFLCPLSPCLFSHHTPTNSNQSPKQSKKQSRKMGTKKV